jgi:hypothetical protein
MGARTCACGCGRSLPSDAHHQAKYLDAKHRKRMEARRYRARKAKAAGRDRRIDGKPVADQSKVFVGADESKDGRASARRGPAYDWLRQHHLDTLRAHAAGRLSRADALDLLADDWPERFPELSGANLSRWAAACVEDDAKGVAQQDWSRDATVEECLADFGAFSRRYWPDDQITGFHMEWADLISEAIDEGGRVLLLASQRHGKSHLLRKYAAWRICRDPDIRILWVSQSEKLAKTAVGYVLDILTQNTRMIEEVLGPGREFRPPTRRNMSWTSEEFTVGVRTKVQASPTMVALGKGGSILSRDADVLIVDDMQEHKHIRSPGIREDDAEWFFTDLMSRKLPNTGVAVIGSRQHLQDIYSEIMKRPSENWAIKVYPVHDPSCLVDEDDHDAHVECMLWPEQYPHWYMQEQRGDQGEGYFQRNMMNNPKDDATILVSAADLERCKDFTRRVGDIPPSSRLVAGIDPAPGKPNAAVLFGWDGEKRHVIDYLETEPGVRGGRRILREWQQLYGCGLFVLEENIAQQWWDDAEMKEFLSSSNVRLEPTWTHRINKHDAAHGVVAMFQHLRKKDPTITFPYGDKASAQKMDRLLKTLLIFDPDYVGNKHADDDLPMAMWFPQKFMDRWGFEWVSRAEVDYPQTGWGDWRTAYPSGSNRHLRAVKGAA